MKLIIDIGNTFTKLALFNSDELIKEEKRYIKNIQQVEDFVKSYNIRSSILSTVTNHNLENDIINRYKTLLLKNETPIPIKSLYTTFETLGLDRIAAMVGANIKFPENDILVFDAGTCLTVDYINSDKIHQGGQIMPGIKMRYDSLHHFTTRLPNLSSDIKKEEGILGRNTESSIHLGVQQGIIQEIEYIIRYYKKENPDIVVMLTGGDCFFLEEALKSSIFVDPFLVLRGLNKILDYNENI